MPGARRAGPRPRPRRPGLRAGGRRPRRDHPAGRGRRPGLVAFPTRGPSRYFGGDAALAERTACGGGRGPGRRRAGGRTPVTGPGRAWPTAPSRPRLAAEAAVRSCGRAARGQPGVPGAAAGGRRSTGPALVDVLGRLGLRTLGALAALPGPDVLARFGAEGHEALAPRRGPRRAGPRPRRPARRPHGQRRARPAGRDRGHRRLRGPGPGRRAAPAALGRGSACTRVVIGAETEHGERLERVWRAEGALTAGRHRRPGPLAARRVAPGVGPTPAHGRDQPAVAGARRGGPRRRPPARVLGQRRRGGRPRRPGRGPGPGPARAPARWPCRSGGAAATRPRRSPWWRRRPSTSPSTALAPGGTGSPAPGRAACPPRPRPGSTPSPSRPRWSTPPVRRCG